MLHGLIGDILAHAAAVAISPIPIVAVILILFTPNARINSLSFLGGWVAGIVIVSAIVLLSGGFTSGKTSTSGQSVLSGILKLGFGALFLGMALRRWIRRPRQGEDPRVPKWMSAIDRFGAMRSVVMGAFLSGVNPKNLALTMATASHIAGAGLSTLAQLAAIAVFVVIACVTVAGPVLLYQAVGTKAEARLQIMKDWLMNNNNTVMIVLLVVFGVKLIGNGFGILTT